MELNFSIDRIEAAASAFIEAMGDDTVFLFDGAMGAGKTTLISSVCRLLGVEDHTGSPTFSLVNEYSAAGGKPIFHFDFYRVDSSEEAAETGIEDYFYSGELCFVEWGEKIESLLPENVRKVSISENPDGSRKLIF